MRKDITCNCRYGRNPKCPVDGPSSKPRTDWPMPMEEFIKELVINDKRSEMYEYFKDQLRKAQYHGRIVAPDLLIPLYKAIRDINAESVENHNLWVELDAKDRKKERKRNAAEKLKSGTSGGRK